MKVFIVLSLAVAASFAAPSEPLPSDFSQRSLPALEHAHDLDELGQYKLKYVTVEGTIVEETGKFVPTADGTDKVLVYEGSYTFIGDDGKTYITKYATGLDGGHKVEGDHLPKAPAVPEVPEVILPKAEGPIYLSPEPLEPLLPLVPAVV